MKRPTLLSAALAVAVVGGLVGSSPAVGSGQVRAAAALGYVSGTVTVAGAPAPDAYVQLHSPGKWASARTAADGTYSTAAEPGTYEVVVLGPSGSTYLTTYLGGKVRPDDSTPLEVVSGASVTADVKLVRGAGVTGRVVDAAGHPVGGATVWLAHVDRFGSTSATTDAHGEYTTYQLATGEVALFAFVDQQRSATRAVAAKRGALTRAPTLTVRKPTGATITGHVRAHAAGDQPVQLLDAKKAGVGWERPDANGDVSFVGLEAGTYTVVLSGTNISRRVTVGATTKASFGTLRRGTPTAVSGRVVSPTGKPAIEAEVRLLDSFGTIAGTAETNAKGYYRIVGAIAGSYTVTAEPDTTTYARGSLHLSVTRGKAKVAPVLRLPSGGRLYGTVKNTKGKPVAGITVYTSNRTAVTDRNGRWLLTGVTPGTRNLTVGDPYVGGYHTEHVSAVARNGKTVRVATVVVH